MLLVMEEDAEEGEQCGECSDEDDRYSWEDPLSDGE